MKILLRGKDTPSTIEAAPTDLNIDLGLQHRDLWISFQPQMAAKGIELCLYEPDEGAEERWLIAYKQASIPSKYSKPVLVSKNISPAINRGRVKKNISGISISFYIPIGSFQDLKTQDLEYMFLYLDALRSEFSWGQYFNEYQKELGYKKNQSNHSMAIGLYLNLKYFLDILNSDLIYAGNAFQILKHIPYHQLLKNFDQLLPSAQFMSIFYELVALEEQRKPNKHNLYVKLTIAHSPVKKFFEEHLKSIEEMLRCFNNKSIKKAKGILKKLKTKIITLVHKDFDYLILQDFILSEQPNPIFHSIPEETREKLKKKVSNFENFLDGKLDFEEVLQSAINSKDSKSWIHLIDRDSINALKLPKGQLLEIGKISPYLGHYLGADYRTKFPTIYAKWENHLYQLMNIQLMPLLTFRWENSALNFQINTESTILNVDHFINQQRETFKELNEVIILERTISMIREIKDLKAWKKQQRSSTKFEFQHHEDQYLHALSLKRAELERELEKQKILMQRFGFNDLSTKYSQATKVAWVKEVVKVEKEVSPFVSFVRKAFHSALPVRRTLEYDPFRNTTDGVDFDPETLQNQQKWMRGEVMTKFRSRISIGNAIQVNAFALDASGSMGHEKMRNLFKVICLMIQGLEDRRSYDAFHFFNNKFYEGANFTEHYTDQSVVAKILTRISQVHRNGGITYNGGGGTNMSDALAQCALRVKKKEEALIRLDPETTVLKSIFIISDGEPSVGITSPMALGEAVDDIRKIDNIAVKGIYLLPKNARLKKDFVAKKITKENIQEHILDLSTRQLMDFIFGKGNFILTNDFRTAVNDFTFTMAATYKKQRQEIKLLKKMKKLGLKRY